MNGWNWFTGNKWKAIIAAAAVLCLIAVGLWSGGYAVLRYVWYGAVDGPIAVIRPDGSPAPAEALAWLKPAAENFFAQSGDSHLLDLWTKHGAAGVLATLHAGTRTFGSGFLREFTLENAPEIFPIRTERGCNLVDWEGNVHLRLGPNVDDAGPVSGGLVAVRRRTVDDGSGTAKAAWAYQNLDGETVVPGPFEIAFPFQEGLAAVAVTQDDGTLRWGMIDTSGAWAIAPRFWSLGGFSNGLAPAEIRADDNTLETAGFIDRSGAFAVTLDGARGMLSSHRDGLALVWYGSSPGYALVDEAGAIALALDYEDVAPFSDGRAPVRVGNAYGYIDTAGALVIPAKYERPASFCRGLAVVVRYSAVRHWVLQTYLTWKEALPAGLG
ncbi:MAG: WG repeat-containing protein [Candidatus Hydrogenedentes bacterium]|nr:WG repeat-containing protein [Candidatus Hydrogenedentota bacterium]